jgi:AraC-like DNA-binding protein
MNAIPLLRANAMLPFVKFLDQIGSPTERLLKQAKLPMFALADPEALLSAYQTFVFVEQAAQLEKMEMLGVLVGQQTEIGDLGLFGQMVQQTLTLYHLLKIVERMIPTLNSTERMWLTEVGDQVWLNHHYLVGRTAIQTRQARLYAVILFLKAVRLAAGPNWQPSEICLQSNYSKKLTEVEEFANIPLRFNQPYDAFAFPKALLSLPLRPPKTSASVQDCCQRLQTTAPSLDFAGSLQQLLHTLLKDGYPNIHWVAESSGMSVRSFQRRLASANLSYSQLVEQVRFDQAMQFLYNPSMPLVEIALELGYNDAANFTRAFKRWTGVPPREFRRLHVSRP